MLPNDLSFAAVGRCGLWVKPYGRVLTEHNSADLVARIVRRVQAEGRTFVYLDLSRIEAIDGHMLGQLAVLHHQLTEEGVKLWLVQLQPDVYQLLRECRLTDILDVRTDLTERPYYYSVRRLISSLRKIRMG